ncbi:MAG TPA: DUF4169 family protein [Sphingomonas sp.]|nr:DUF4169 family protein [Sphingomonas sp.]
MGEVVNLRRARKAKARVRQEVEAGANRAAFGRTKTEKQAAKADAARRERALDGAKRE